MADDHGNDSKEKKDKKDKDAVPEGKVKVVETKTSYKDAHDSHPTGHGIPWQWVVAGGFAAIIGLGMLLNNPGIPHAPGSDTVSGGTAVTLTHQAQPLPRRCTFDYDVIEGSIDLLTPGNDFITVNAGENNVTYPNGFAPSMVRAHGNKAVWKPTFSC